MAVCDDIWGRFQCRHRNKINIPFRWLWKTTVGLRFKRLWLRPSDSTDLDGSLWWLLNGAIEENNFSLHLLPTSVIPSVISSRILPVFEDSQRPLKPRPTILQTLMSLCDDFWRCNSGEKHQWYLVVEYCASLWRFPQTTAASSKGSCRPWWLLVMTVDCCTEGETRDEETVPDLGPISPSPSCTSLLDLPGRDWKDKTGLTFLMFVDNMVVQTIEGTTMPGGWCVYELSHYGSKVGKQVFFFICTV